MPALAAIQEHTFFPLHFDHQTVIIDAGANTGDFSRECAIRYGCTPYAIEPNPTSAAQITDAHVFSHALGAETRSERFFVGAESQGCSLVQHPDHTTSRVVAVVALREFLAEHGLQSVDLLKLDIEGAELELLPTLTVSMGIAQISVEFHDFLYPEQRHEVERTIAHMKSAGFNCFNFSKPLHTDVLFINPRLLHLPLKSTLRARARVLARYAQRRFLAISTHLKGLSFRLVGFPDNQQSQNLTLD